MKNAPTCAILSRVAKLPAVISVTDYHEFTSVQDVINALGLKGTRVCEIGVLHGKYVGMIYAGNISVGINGETVKKLKADIKNQ